MGIVTLIAYILSFLSALALSYWLLSSVYRLYKNQQVPGAKIILVSCLLMIFSIPLILWTELWLTGLEQEAINHIKDTITIIPFTVMAFGLYKLIDAACEQDIKKREL